MALYQYDGYCYASASDLLTSLQSSPPINYATGTSFIQGATVVNETIGQITYIQNYKPYGAGVQTTMNVTRTFPPCSSEGFMHSNTNMSVPDALAITSLIITAWAVAYSFKLLRRAL